MTLTNKIVTLLYEPLKTFLIPEECLLCSSRISQSQKKRQRNSNRHFALKIQQPVEKSWCNENASTINLKYNEIFTKGLSKNLKDFANKRQVKHTFIALKPSIPFHTLVNFIDAEEIANDKTRTHDLAREVNNITKPLQIQTLDSSQRGQLKFTHSRFSINKNKPAYKKIAHIAIEKTTPFLLALKNNEMMKIKEMLMLDQNLLKYHLFSTFVLLQMMGHNDMIHVFEVEVIHDIIIITKMLHKTNIVLHPDIDLVMTKVLHLHKTLDHDTIIISEIRDPIALFIYHHLIFFIDTIFALDINHVPIQEIITILQNTHFHIDRLQDQEILDFLDPVHILIREINLIQFNHNTKMS